MCFLPFHALILTQAPLSWMAALIETHPKPVTGALHYWAEAAYLEELGWQQYYQEELNAAAQTFQSLLLLYEEARDLVKAGEVLHDLSLFLYQQGNFVQALYCGRQALELAEAIAHPLTIGANRSQLGLISYQMGQFSEAIHHYQTALAVFKEADDVVGVGRTLNDLGMVYSRLDQPQRAGQLCAAAASILEEVGDQFGEATAFHNAGVAQFKRGSYEQAAKLLERALAIRVAIGDFSGEATTFSRLGLVYQHLNQPSYALACYREALELHQALAKSYEDEPLEDTFPTLECDAELAMVSCTSFN